MKWRLSILLLIPVIFQLWSSAWADDSLAVISREAQLKSFPCSKCHSTYRADFTVNKAKTHKALVLKHMPELAECRMCHSSAKPNQLNLLDGTIIKIDEMPRLCGQCHGKIEFEWRRGLHGKFVGTWRDNKSRWLCAECHDPHSPKFRSMEAVATPFQSQHVIPKEDHSKEGRHE